MTNQGARNQQGPNEAEQRMWTAYDTFNTLLRTRPTEAKRMAYEVEAIAQRYEKPQKGQE